MNQKAKVLVIDDEQRILLTMQILLQDEYDVTTIDNGKAGIEEAATTDFDVAIVDILMPKGLSGMETLEKLKQISPATEIIFFTGCANHNTVKFATKHGAFAHVEKSGDPTELKSLISRAVQLRRSRQQRV